MPICWHCGDEIEFRYIDGRPTPIHLSGGWCQGGEGTSYFPRTSFATSGSRFEDVCHPTRCPKCGTDVFFVRHNGGSVWLDDLCWPWPKHACFDNALVPSWFTYIKKLSFLPNAGNPILFGAVIKARWLPEDELGPFRIILAVDGGAKGRACLATTGTNTPDYLLGRVAIVDVESERLVTSNHEVRPILRVPVRPVELGLPADWATVKVKR